MAKIDFPTPAVQGDTHTQNGISWVYNGEAWDPLAAAGGGGLANIVEDTTPELGGDLLVGTNSFTVSGTSSDIPVLGISNSGSNYDDDFSIQIKSGSAYGDHATIEVLDQTGSGYNDGNLTLKSASASFGGAGKIQLDNYIFNSNESLTGKTGQVLTYNGTNIQLAAGGAPDNTAYGSSWNGNLDAASKNAIYDKIETLGITTDPAFDALGDLIVGSGSNTSSRLPVGSTDQVLTVVGGTATWATSSGGGTQQGTGSTYYNIIPASEPFRTRSQAGEYSVDLQTRGANDDVAAGDYSVLIGGKNNSAAGSYSSVIGGESNSISTQGSKSTIIASSSSSVTYSNSAVIAHSGNVNTTTLSTYNSAVIAGTQHQLDGFMAGGYSAIIGGNSNSGYYAEKSVMLGGNDNSCDSINSSVILGGNNNDLQYSTGCIIGGTRVKSIGTPLGRLNGVFAYADDTAADYTITQGKTANFRVANGMHITAPLFIDERASALADIAGRGQIWVKTATPNELWFTDDAGSDRPISEGVYTVATLPTGVTGRRAFVTDSNNALSNHHGQTVAAGGANFVPVYHDGSNWIVG